jgi:L-rhamnose mutarotase
MDAAIILYIFVEVENKKLWNGVADTERYRKWWKYMK